MNIATFVNIRSWKWAARVGGVGVGIAAVVVAVMSVSSSPSRAGRVTILDPHRNLGPIALGDHTISFTMSNPSSATCRVVGLNET